MEYPVRLSRRGARSYTSPRSRCQVTRRSSTRTSEPLSSVPVVADLHSRPSSRVDSLDRGRTGRCGTDPCLCRVIPRRPVTKQARTVELGRTTSWGTRFLGRRLCEFGPQIAAAPRTPQPERWSNNAITLAWLGHATVLINFYGVRILTDPVLFRRIGVQLGLGTLGPLRLVSCALPVASLPDLDLVLVTHAHFDHLDRPSLRSVRGRPAAVMAPATADLLPRRRYRSISELRWNEATHVSTSRGDVRVRAIEVQHWGARVGRDTWRGYAGFVLEREGRRLLI